MGNIFKMGNASKLIFACKKFCYCEKKKHSIENFPASSKMVKDVLEIYFLLLAGMGRVIIQLTQCKAALIVQNIWTHCRRMTFF